MMTRISIFILLFVAVPIAAHSSLTDDEESKIQILTEQVTALTYYIERTYVPDAHTPLTHASLRNLIETGSSWLASAQEESGHFAYEYVPYEGIYLDDDHMVRQAGALYALGEIARRDPQNSINTRETMSDAIDYFKKISRVGEFEDIEFTCIANNETSQRCMLGATSLALIGILSYIEQNPEAKNRYEDLVEGYVSYILAMKKPSAGFRNDYRVGASLQSSTESSFSNGEAVLALTRYYTYKQREDVREIIDQAYSYLEASEFDVPLYLWIMAALKDMHRLWPEEKYITYGNAYTKWRMNALQYIHNTTLNYCALNEGLVSAYSLLQGQISTEQLQELRKELDFWNKKNSTLQITSKDKYRVIPSQNGEISMGKLADTAQALGGFLTGEQVPTQRIDFTQHCLGSYVQTFIDIEKQSF